MIDAPERTRKETFEAQGSQLVEEVKDLIHEGNVRRIVIKQDSHTIVEIPLTVGVIGAVIAPALAAVGAVAALVTRCTIDVERDAAAPPASDAPSPQPRPRSARVRCAGVRSHPGVRPRGPQRRLPDRRPAFTSC